MHVPAGAARTINAGQASFDEPKGTLLSGLLAPLGRSDLESEAMERLQDLAEAGDLDPKGFSFRPLLESMGRSGAEWTDRQSLIDYVRKYLPGIKPPKAPKQISVQSWKDLRSELKVAGAMVFRLGKGHFALYRVPEGELFNRFFLPDPEIFGGTVETFMPDASISDLYPFQLLGSIQESGAVNLAIASGILESALRLDRPAPRIAPARGQSTYTFEVVPEAAKNVHWTHAGGQVEVDSVFVARREGQWKLFVIEAKHGAPSKDSSLAKHKLAYPALVLAGKKLPPDIEIVPIYLRTWLCADSNRLNFGVAECQPWPRHGATIASLTCSPGRVLSLPADVFGAEELH